MDDKKTWPIVLGVTAGVIGGIVAGLLIYSAHMQDHPDSIRDAQELIEQCHKKIKEIENGLEAIRQPFEAVAR